jgi:predicted metal-dependent phosphoesterase TrpH
VTYATRVFFAWKRSCTESSFKKQLEEENKKWDLVGWCPKYRVILRGNEGVLNSNHPTFACMPGRLRLHLTDVFESASKIAREAIVKFKNKYSHLPRTYNNLSKNELIALSDLIKMGAEISFGPTDKNLGPCVYERALFVEFCREHLLD